MIETIDLPANLPLGGVWQDAETQRLYFRLGEILLAARVGSISQGRAALYLVDFLPENAVPQELPTGYEGAEVRRLLVCLAGEDEEEELVLALDLGRDRYLCFVMEYEEATEARRMYPAASHGEIEGEIRHAARFPEKAELPEEVVKSARFCLRLFGFGAAMLLSSAVCGFLFKDSWVVGGMLALAFLLCGVAFVMMKRPAVCPWCGEKALFLGDYSRMTCHSCNNDCALPR
ncbi:MAG: hypothetical protein UHH87_01770 [Akkermansia sp.]|nr:hypothetical protein [Akkermansia sp.]